MNRISPPWVFALALTAAAWAASVWIYPRLPASIPVHWNIHGVVDGYGPKASTLCLFPAFMIGMLGLFRVMPVLSPKGFEVDTSRTALRFVMVGVIGLFAYMHGVILLATWQQVTKAPHPLDIGRALFAGLFLALALIGTVLGKIPRNFYVGVRVPWTLASDRVWNDTHRLAAWTTVAGGVVGFLAVVAGWSLVYAVAALGVSVVVPIVYSFVHYKRLEKQGAV